MKRMKKIVKDGKEVDKVDEQTGNHSDGSHMGKGQGTESGEPIACWAGAWEPGKLVDLGGWGHL